MSIKKALRFYEELSNEQKRLVNEKQIDSSMQVREWIDFLANAAAYDEYGDNARKKNTFKIVLYTIGIIVSIIVTFLLPLLGIPMIIVFVLLLAEAIRVQSKLKRLDLSNHLRLFLMPLLYIFAEKAGEKATLALSLDFRDPKKANPVKKYKELNSDIQLYEPKYIIGKLKLKDETIMEFMLSDEIRAMRIVKTRPGKTKIKTKDKVTRYYFIKLSFPKKYYRLKNGSSQSARVEETPEVIICKLKAKSKSSVIQEVLEVGEFLNSVGELYALIQVKPDAKLPEAAMVQVVPEKPSAEPGMMPETMDTTGMLPVMLWSGAYFSTHDYSGFSRSGTYFSSDSTGRDTFFDS